MKHTLQFLLSSTCLIAAIGISYFLHDTIHVVISLILLILLSTLALHKKLHPLFYVLLPMMASVYVVGSIFDLFRQFYYFDLLVHFVAAFVITLLCGQLLSTTKVHILRKDLVLLFVLITCVGITIGAVWEIFEWLVSLSLPPGRLIRGSSDTALDLIIDSVGALLASFVSIRLFYFK